MIIQKHETQYLIIFRQMVFSKVRLATIGEILLSFRLILSVNRHVKLFSQSN